MRSEGLEDVFFSTHVAAVAIFTRLTLALFNSNMQPNVCPVMIAQKTDTLVRVVSCRPGDGFESQL